MTLQTSGDMEDAGADEDDELGYTSHVCRLYKLTENGVGVPSTCFTTSFVIMAACMYGSAKHNDWVPAGITNGA